ncbi:hypothetical protein DES53_102532 [Roseimicrobium gellanilyticum]|uniref:Uncharacterized protein n=1 Tax=Roseimicrobium gellanilyticum TaxID=748857 RepID=A0A366HRM3_9BACT|nr:hypothetical protein [Roseimicrobium gellanilyticum]RBP46146.1 hypothetical protein DES53_102532 [Roseimicrobium gellanilyticum]
MSDSLEPVPPVPHIPSPHDVPPPSTLKQVENMIREHPVATILTIVGVGCAVGIVLKELLTPPPPPKSKALRLLEDIQARLAHLTERPAYRKASHLAEDGVDAVKRGLHSLEKRWAGR